jgi:hypothetical protein
MNRGYILIFQHDVLPLVQVENLASPVEVHARLKPRSFRHRPEPPEAQERLKHYFRFPSMLNERILKAYWANGACFSFLQDPCNRIKFGANTYNYVTFLLSHFPLIQRWPGGEKT